MAFELIIRDALRQHVGGDPAPDGDVIAPGTSGFGDAPARHRRGREGLRRIKPALLDEAHQVFAAAVVVRDHHLARPVRRLTEALEEGQEVAPEHRWRHQHAVEVAVVADQVGRAPRDNLDHRLVGLRDGLKQSLHQRRAIIGLVVELHVTGELAHQAVRRTDARLSNGHAVVAQVAVVLQERLVGGHEPGVLRQVQGRPVVPLLGDEVLGGTAPHPLQPQLRRVYLLLHQVAHRRVVGGDAQVTGAIRRHLDTLVLPPEHPPLASVEAESQAARYLVDGQVAILGREAAIGLGGIEPQLPARHEWNRPMGLPPQRL